jgi:hypothetical protein
MLTFINPAIVLSMFMLSFIMNVNINIDSTITGSMNDNINMNSTIAGSMNDNINMDSTTAVYVYVDIH